MPSQTKNSPRLDARQSSARNRSSKKANSDLFCSFCGKSQHEVLKLIAGPTVFICNECTELCNDIVIEETSQNAALGENRLLVTIVFEDPLKPIEQRYLPCIIDGIEKAYPGCRAGINSYTKRSTSDVLSVEFTSPVKIAGSDINSLENEIRRLTVELRIAQQKLIAEKHSSEKFEKMYRKLQDDVMPLVIERLRQEGSISNHSIKSLTIMFLDIVGFSKLTEAEVGLKLDYIRSLIRTLIAADSGFYVNTWGDGVVAGFDEINSGLKCAWKIAQHLSLDGIDVRISAHWGNARIKLNELTNREDIDGDSVNFSARLEPLAEPGEVLVSEDARFHPDIDAAAFEFNEVKRKVKKAFLKVEAGTDISAFSLRYLKNR